MGSSSTKEVNITKSFDEKEVSALRSCFKSIVQTDPGKESKIPCITNSKGFHHVFEDYDDFLDKLYAWMVYWKENMIGDDIKKKSISQEGIWTSSFLLSMEVLTKWMTSTLYYNEYQREDIFKLLLYILKTDMSNPNKYFASNSLSNIENITYKEAEKVFNLAYNFLNKSSDTDYAPFPFLKSIFEYKNKEKGKNTDDWDLTYDSFKIQLKRVIPFTIKFLGKYFECKTIYNPEFAKSESGEVLFSASTLNAKTVKMPVLKEETIQKSSLIDKMTWTTLFLAMPNLEFWKDFDVIYNSSADGLSFNRLSNHIIGYKGPMIFLIKHSKHSGYEDEKSEELAEDWVLGAYVSEEMRDSAKFGGDLNSCIFQFSPELKVMRTYNNKGGTNYAYLNTVKIENSQYPYGLGFGGSTVEFRMWLDGDNIVDKSYVTPEDTTYEIGYIMESSVSKSVKVSKIEVYGLGGVEAREAQEEHRRALQNMRDKKKKVDKKAFLESDFDKEFLLGGTYGHRKEMENREGGS